MSRLSHRHWSDLPVFWQIFLPNAAVLTLAVGALAFTPVTVSQPILLGEALVLAGGLLAMVVMNLVLIRRAVAPLARLAEAMSTVDPLEPGRRAGEIAGTREATQLAGAFDLMLDRLESERRASARSMLAAQERERLRLSRELHDELGQSITGVMLAVDHIARGAPDPTRSALVELREALRQLSDEVRVLVRRLRPEALDDLGLPSALLALTDQFTYQTGVPVDRAIDQLLPELREEYELAIYRVAQESLTNAARHASASQVSFEFRRTETDLHLRIADDGRGINGAPEGAGIRGMRERAMLIGAQFRIGRAVDGGAEILLTIPASPKG